MNSAVKFSGGLGNQLFQLAFALFLLEEHPHRLTLDVSSYRKRVRSVAPRIFELKPNYLPFEIDSSLFRSHWRSLLLPNFQDDGTPYREWEEALLSRKSTFVGYFSQFELVGQVLPRLLPIIWRHLEPTAETSDAVGVHIRLGDYLRPKPRGLLGVTDPKWSLRQAKLLAAEIGVQQIEVFSDSPEILDRWLDEDTTVRVMPKQTSWVALQELASCAAIVTSNSTFSWWAAFLQPWVHGVAGPVVAPSPWLQKRTPQEELLLPTYWKVRARDVL